MWSRRTRWLVAVALGVFSPIGLVACALPPAGLASSEDTTMCTTGTGQVIGVVTQQSGISSTPSPVRTPVMAVPADPSANQTWSTQTAADGSYSLDLPSGTYRVSEWAGSNPETVTVEPCQTTRVDIRFIAPWEGGGVLLCSGGALGGMRFDRPTRRSDGAHEYLTSLPGVTP